MGGRRLFSSCLGDDTARGARAALTRRAAVGVTVRAVAVAVAMTITVAVAVGTAVTVVVAVRGHDG
jgi:hypothetical protein